MFHSVLVAHDGSDRAKLALVQAADIALSEHIPLTILSAYEVLPPTVSSMAPALATDQSDYLDAMQKEAETTLQEAVETLDKSIAVHTKIVAAPAVQAILEEITAAGHDLVVLGSRGRGAFGSMVLGSVSHAVLHHAKIPVLIVNH